MSRVTAIRELVGGNGPRRDGHDDGARGRGLVRAAFWAAGIGAGGLLLRRVLRRRRAIDVGGVSDDWIASHREPPDQSGW